MVRQGYVTGPVLGIFWAFIVATTVAVILSFSTGEAFRPGLFGCLILGAGMGAAAFHVRGILPSCIRLVPGELRRVSLRI